MGIISTLFRKKDPSARHSARVDGILDRNQQRPLDSDCCRLIVISEVRSFSFDVPLALVEKTLREYAEAGVGVSRDSAAQVLGLACTGRDDSHPDLVRLAALAYFELPFLNAQGPWNTLTLFVTVSGTAIFAAANAVFLTYAPR